MGRLTGFKYREVARKLRTFGFVFDRHGLTLRYQLPTEEVESLLGTKFQY